jgi:tetrahydromethanopterin S-methyltransferase subunit A
MAGKNVKKLVILYIAGGNVKFVILGNAKLFCHFKAKCIINTCSNCVIHPRETKVGPHKNLLAA